jgi:hypothetical protein
MSGAATSAHRNLLEQFPRNAARAAPAHRRGDPLLPQIAIFVTTITAVAGAMRQNSHITVGWHAPSEP